MKSLSPYRMKEYVLQSYPSSWEEPGCSEILSWDNFEPSFDVSGKAYSDFGVYLSDDTFAEARRALDALRDKLSPEAKRDFNVLAEIFEVCDAE